MFQEHKRGVNCPEFVWGSVILGDASMIRKKGMAHSLGALVTTQ